MLVVFTLVCTRPYTHSVGMELYQQITMHTATHTHTHTHTHTNVRTCTLKSVLFVCALHSISLHTVAVECGNMTLAAFVWTSEKPREPSSLRAYIGLFDLNQWYHAQMPVKVSWKKKGPGEHLPLLGCEYFAFFSILDGHSSIRGEKIQSVLVSYAMLPLYCTISPQHCSTHFQHCCVSCGQYGFCGDW